MTKEELREDPVLERIQGFVRFTERNVRWIITAAVVVAVAIIALIALQKSHARSEREASQLLAEAQGSYLSGNYAMAETQCRQLLDNYGGSASAATARLYLGDALLTQERPADALLAYEEAAEELGDFSELLAAAHRGRAAALENLARFGEASDAYAAAAQSGELQRPADEVSAARTALRAGDVERARRLLDAIEDRGSGPYATQISLLQAQLTAAEQ
jgi:predicted negative regulator of RcsB-dependent stress response